MERMSEYHRQLTSDPFTFGLPRYTVSFCSSEHHLVPATSAVLVLQLTSSSFPGQQQPAWLLDIVVKWVLSGRVAQQFPALLCRCAKLSLSDSKLVLLLDCLRNLPLPSRTPNMQPRPRPARCRLDRSAAWVSPCTCGRCWWWIVVGGWCSAGK